MPLPDPANYGGWQSWASALLKTLTDGSGGIAAATADTSTSAGTVTTSPEPTLPDGYDPVFWNPTGGFLAVGDNFLTAPDIVNPFQIDTQSLADASVELQQIADGAVGTNKLIDLAVVNAKIANATILSAKIGNLQVVTALIADLSVITAKIDNLAVNSAKIANLSVSQAAIQALAVGQAQIAALSVTAAKIANATITNTQIANATILTANIGNAQITSALILDAAILSADIGLAQIITALIGSAQITSALIGSAQILAAHIANAQISSAKITDLVVSKITAGTLDAIIDVGTGLLRFTIGGNKLCIGKGFGTSSQFIMWFGPDMVETAMSEYNAVFYLKTDGSAYFGGSLLAGTLTNSAQTTNLSHTASAETGPFGSNGGTRTYTVSYQDNQSLDWTTGNMTATGTYDATIVLEADYGSGFTALGSSHTFTGSNTIDNTDKTYRALISGSFTYTDSSGGLGPINVRARLTGRNDYTLGGGFGGAGTFFESQRLGIVSVEP